MNKFQDHEQWDKTKKVENQPKQPGQPTEKAFPPYSRPRDLDDKVKIDPPLKRPELDEIRHEEEDQAKHNPMDFYLYEHNPHVEDTSYPSHTT